MPPTTREQDLRTGVESIDTEHRLLVTLVSALDELARARREAPLLAKAFGQLVDFANVHFLSEELMMRIYAYPGRDAHKAEHGRLAQQMADTRRSFESGGEPVALAAIDGLRGWLVEHITRMDQAFAHWCEQNGIRAR